MIPSFNLDESIISENVDEQTPSRMIFSIKWIFTIFCNFFCSSVIDDDDNEMSMDSNALILFLDESVALVFSLSSWTVARACTSFNCSFQYPP